MTDSNKELKALKVFQDKMFERNARLRTAVFVKEWMEGRGIVWPAELREDLIAFCNQALEDKGK
ncbi:MAG: hypothetical protein ACR2OK_01895 [Parvibaculales bacterium]